MEGQPRLEGRGELLAREIVARCLDAVVERYDDGSSSRMPDGLIRYADGRTAGLEVVGDHDETYMRHSAALAQIQHELTVAGLRWSWFVSLEHRTSVKRLSRALPTRLLKAEEGAASPEEASEALRQSSVEDDLGLFTVTATSNGPAGRIRLSAEPFSGFGVGAYVLTTWVEEVLRRQPDVAEKLAAANLGDEGHAFIWVTISSDVGVQTALDADSTDLPCSPPQLPVGVTHVWVVSSLTQTRGIAWFPDTGWHVISFHWVDGEPLHLTQPS